MEEPPTMHPDPVEPTILYVDDQPSHRALFQKSFQSECLVLTASSAEEGLEIVQGHDIFLVIADHNMPGKNGVDFLEEVRTASPKAVRAILSAYSDPELVREAKSRAEIAEYLRKPWKRDEVKRFIENSFRAYRLGGEVATPRPEPVTVQRLSGLVENLESVPCTREVRRILLNHVEPRLRETVALIVRPCSPFLRKAEEEGLKGHVREMERALVGYLQEPADLLTDPSALIKH